MNEWWLIISFCLLLSAAFVATVYPFRKNIGKWWLLVLPIFVVLVIGAYQQWGAWTAWQDHLYEQARQEKARAILATIKSPAQLAQKLKAKLDNTPASARGWYLLGRIYASQLEWSSARDAFAKSYQLHPADELAAINYAQSLWQLNKQTFDEQIRSLLKEILINNPNQPDALAMLAMDAYECHDYSQAQIYWQQLLKLAPVNSREAKAIQKAIAKAQQQQNLPTD